MKRRSSFLRIACLASLTALTVAIPFGAAAGVRKEGTWPAEEKRVTLDFDGTPAKGLEELADEAGWSLVVSKDALPTGSDVHVDVKNQPADAVLDALFASGDVVARRNGDLVTVTAGAPANAAAPVAAPPEPSSPDGTSEPAKDREIVGGSLVLGKDERAHDVTVTGGSVRIEGTVTGDLVVLGGSAVVARGAHVVGSATAVAGSLRIEDGARVDGRAGVVGGYLKRDPGARIGGDVFEASTTRSPARVQDHAESDASPASSAILRMAHELGQRVTRWSLLFVLGCVLLSLLAGPMETVRVAAAAKPMRSFAIGIVSAIVIPIALVFLTLTVVGIPLAILSVLVLVFALYGAIAAVVTTLGALIVGHRTKNPFLHLAAGCALALVVGLVPWLGTLATTVLGFVALGALVRTHGGGLIVLSRRKPARLV